MVGVVLVRYDLKRHTGVTYILPTVLRNVMKFNDPKGVCALNTLIPRPTCAAANTTEKPPKLFGIGCIPYIFIFRLKAMMAIFQ